jgi:hypothetical protein
MKLPRSLLDPTPEETATSKKRRKAKIPIATTPKKTRTSMDLLTTPVPAHEDIDSDEDMAAVALANAAIPEPGVATSQLEGTDVWQAPHDPSFMHPASQHTTSVRQSSNLTNQYPATNTFPISTNL